MVNTFDQIWRAILDNLSPGQSILNWTAKKGFLGDKMTLEEVNKTGVIIHAPKANNLIYVSCSEFEKMWNVWPSYKAGKASRREICDLTFYSKYVISVLRWVEEKN